MRFYTRNIGARLPRVIHSSCKRFASAFARAVRRICTCFEYPRHAQYTRSQKDATPTRVPMTTAINPDAHSAVSEPIAW